MIYTKVCPLALALGITGSYSVFTTVATAAPQPGDETLSPWSIAAEREMADVFLSSALPISGTKCDLVNETPSFFRSPSRSAHEPATVLYVGFQAEQTPTDSPYRVPLYSGSVESFDLGISGAQPAPQTVGDIGEIYPENAPAIPMSYIVYRLDYSTRSGDIALFAPPVLTIEPFTTKSPEALDSRYAWESIRFNIFRNLDENGFELLAEAPHTPGRLAPEPTSVALLGLGLLGFAGRRSRKASLK